MTDAEQKPTTESVVLNKLIAEYLERVDSGETVDREQFIAQHPEQAASLKRYFENEAAVDQLVGTEVPKHDQTIVGPADNTEPGIEDATLIGGGADSQTSVSPAVANKPGDGDIPESFGRYKIEKSLGQGAMGAVYLAHDTQLDRKVALKIPKFGDDPGGEMLTRFYREAKAAAMLRSPNICPVFDVGEIDGQHYITMAFIEGRPLRDFTRSNKKHSEKQITVIMRKLAVALSEAHAEGVIHRDLKPANIMVDGKGEPVVMDFGLARRSANDEVQVTHSGAILGTPAYMSPEQVEGNQKEIGPPADIYSLGVIMYELITGQMPFQGTMMSILQQIAIANPEPPNELRKGLDSRLNDICLKMMAKDKAERYATMKEVARDLTEVLKAPAPKPVEEEQDETDFEVSPKSDIEESSPALRTGMGEAKKKLDSTVALTAAKLQTSAKKVPPKALIAVAGLLVAVGILYGAMTFFVRVGDVDVKVVIDDPSLAVKFGDKTVTFEGAGSPIKLKPGGNKFIVERDGLEVTTDEFNVKKGGKNVLHVSILNDKVVVDNKDEIKPAVVDGGKDPDRAVAEWVLSQGGRIKTSERNLTGELPKGKFQLTAVIMQRNSKLEDENLKLLKKCTALLELNLASSSIGDEGIAYLKGHRSLVQLNVGNTNVSDSGLAVLKGIPNLEQVHLPLAKNVTDEGLAHLQQIKSLQKIGIVGTSVTAAGVAKFKKALPNCEVFWKGDTTTESLPTATGVDLKKGLVGHWNFEEGEGTKVADSSGNGNDGSFSRAAPEWTRDAPPSPLAGNTCVTLGENAWAEVPSSESLDITGPITLTGWAKIHHVGKDGPDLLNKDGNEGFRLAAGGLFVLGSTQGLRTTSHQWNRDKPANRRWVHIAARYDGQKMEVYRDGKLSAERETQGPIPANTDKLQIGMRSPGNDTSLSIDDVRIYNRALNEAEIQVLAGKAKPATNTASTLPTASGVDLKKGLVGHWNFEEGEGTKAADSSGNGNDGSIRGKDLANVWTTDKPPVSMAGKRSLRFSDGDQDVFIQSSPSLEIGNEITLVGWLKVHAVAREHRQLVKKEGNTSYRLEGDGNFVLGTASSPPSFSQIGRFKSEIPMEEWYHIAASYDGKTMRTYLNGQLDSQVPLSKPIRTSKFPLQLGIQNRFTASDVNFDDVRIYNRALNEAEIQVLAGKATAGANSDISGAWRPLFDGKSLDGWEQFGGADNDWKVANGILTGTGKQNRLIYTAQTFENYDIRVECRLDAQANSGVTVHTNRSDKAGVGHEAQLAFAETPANAGCYVGGLYRVAPFNESLVHPGEWFTLEVQCRGPKLTLFVNGQQTIEYEDPAKKFSSGHVALLLWNGGVAEFRKVEVRDGNKVTNASEPLTPGESPGGKNVPPPAVVPFDAAQAKAHQKAWADYLGLTVEKDVELPGGETMTFMLIPPGEFLMGGTPEEIATDLKASERYPNKFPDLNSGGPQFRVRITRPYYLGKYEVTRAQYKSMMGIDPAVFPSDKLKNPPKTAVDVTKYPVETVSWFDAATFCSKLSEQEKLDPFYTGSDESMTIQKGNGFRLPTEAEWEFACRAGTTTRYWTGDSPDTLSSAARFGFPAEGPIAVGQLLPNPFQLYDVHGNVDEWVQDPWSQDYYEQNKGRVVDNPVGPSTPSEKNERVSRGGYWAYPPTFCRSSRRKSLLASNRGGYTGFRVALPIDSAKLKTSQATPIDTERATAEWVIAMGGTLETNLGNFKTAEKLPDEPFQITSVELLSPKQLNDDSLSNLAELPYLKKLFLHHAGITGVGLEHLEASTELNYCNLDANPISDAGLVALSQFPKLGFLRLTGSKVTDDGVALLKQFKQLLRLELANTQLSDKAIPHLKELTSLNRINLTKSNVTPTGIADLQKALPDCKIEWDEAK